MKKKLDKPIWVPGHDGPRQITEFVMPNAPKVFNKPPNFDRALKRLKETGSISLDDFSNTAEIGAFIDFYNQNVVEKKQKETNEHIHEISKFLLKTMISKTFILGDPSKKQDIVDTPEKG